MNVYKKSVGLGVIIVLGFFWACSTQQNSGVFGEPPSSNPQIASAQKFFKHCVKLGRAYQPHVTDCYSDTTLINVRRTYPCGKVGVVKIPAWYYKSLAPKIMPLAKASGDRSRFSNVRYRTEGNNVRITAIRYSERKKFYSSYSALVGRSPQGKMAILEEFLESRP